MTVSRGQALGMILILGLAAAQVSRADASAGPLSMSMAQNSTPSEKDARTPAQQKINSQLLYEIYRRRGEAAQKGIPDVRTDVRIDARGRALVDVRAVPVSGALQKKIKRIGGIILSVTLKQHSIMAWIPLLQLERLAEDRTVRFIEPAAEATTVH
jgi:hypothetical protein